MYLKIQSFNLDKNTNLDKIVNVNYSTNTKMSTRSLALIKNYLSYYFNRALHKALRSYVI
jgi:hypothetical protein